MPMRSKSIGTDSIAWANDQFVMLVTGERLWGTRRQSFFVEHVANHAVNAGGGMVD